MNGEHERRWGGYRGFDVELPGVRVFQVAASQPSWVMRSALLAAGAVLMAILLLILVPVVLAGVVVFAAGMMAARARRWLDGLRQPNGVLDGRRNVRVIVRREGE